MAKSGRFLGRNPILSKGINKLGLVLAGGLYLANIHFSAVAIQQIASLGGNPLIPPALAQEGLAMTLGRYVVALSVSIIATILLGILIHPSGLASFVEEVRAIRGAKASKVMGALIVTVAIVIVIGGGLAVYTYDFYTTCAAFGLPLRALFSLAAVPVWVNVLGPEFLFYGTNMYGYLIDGKADGQPAMGGSRPQTPQPRPTAAQMPTGLFNLRR